MTRSVARVTLAASLLGGAFAAPADAGCVGSNATVKACWQMVPVFSDCVYTGGEECLQVDSALPLCVYGTILGGPYATVWC